MGNGGLAQRAGRRLDRTRKRPDGVAYPRGLCHTQGSSASAAIQERSSLPVSRLPPPTTSPSPKPSRAVTPPPVRLFFITLVPERGAWQMEYLRQNLSERWGSWNVASWSLLDRERAEERDRETETGTVCRKHTLSPNVRPHWTERMLDSGRLALPRWPTPFEESIEHGAKPQSVWVDFYWDVF